MCYPMLYPSGESGWSIDIPHDGEHATGKRTSVTLLQYYTYKWSVRGTFNPLHHAGYLTQQKMVDDWLKVESSQLDYIKKQQSRLRVESLHGLYDHVYNNIRNNCITNQDNSNSPPSSPSQVLLCHLKQLLYQLNHLLFCHFNQLLLDRTSLIHQLPLFRSMLIILM